MIKSIKFNPDNAYVGQGGTKPYPKRPQNCEQIGRQHEWVMVAPLSDVQKGMRLESVWVPGAFCKRCVLGHWSASCDMDTAFNIVVLVGEDFEDYKFLRSKLDKLTLLKPEVMVFSVDPSLPGLPLAEKWAFASRWSVVKWIHKTDKKFDARKELYKKMLRKASAVVVFWDTCDEEIAYILKRAKKRKLPIREYLV